MTPAEDILVFYSVTKCYKGNSEQFLSISMQDWFYIIPCTLLNRLLGICTVWRLYVQPPRQPQLSRWPYPPQQPNLPQPPLSQPQNANNSDNQLYPIRSPRCSSTMDRKCPWPQPLQHWTATIVAIMEVVTLLGVGAIVDIVTIVMDVALVRGLQPLSWGASGCIGGWETSLCVLLHCACDILIWTSLLTRLV